jgi:hypothetical protein
MIIATVASALVTKKITDDAAKKQERQMQQQQKEAKARADEANKKFLEQQQAEAVNPNLVKKTGIVDTGTDQLKVKKTAGAAMNTLGMGGGSGTGVNIA